MDTVVVKIGGSLAMYPSSLRALCQKLNDLSKKHRLVVIPGGGEFADTVRTVDKRFNLSSKVSHQMAILSMDQYGLMLTELIPNSVTAVELEEISKTHDSCKVPVFLPSKLLFHEDPLENSWDVTSDSIALYIADRLQAAKVLLVTDVDGVFTSDPRQEKWARLIEKVTPTELSATEQRTSVDRKLPKLLLKWQIDCFVVNGLFPERVEAILHAREDIYTTITKNS